MEKYQNITVDDLLKHFELLEYPSFGYGAVNLYRGTGQGEDWQAHLRNPMKWEHVPECRAADPKEALIKLYEYCVQKKYLPELPIAEASNLDKLKEDFISHFTQKEYINLGTVMKFWNWIVLYLKK